MTALPQPLTHPLTVVEYLALGEDEHGRYELQGGSVVVSPSPSPDHVDVIAELITQLRGQMPPEIRLLPDVDFDLQLTRPDGPGWVRRPDLLIVSADAKRRVRREGGILRADEVIVAVEVVSPASERIDHVIKRGEYADAGIPRYWIIDTDEPLTLIDCQLAEGLGYQDAGAITGRFTTEIFDRAGMLRLPLRLELDQLFGR